MDWFYIIDGNSYLYRVYFAIPPLETSYGLKTNAVYGFTKMLLKMLNEKKPKYLAVCFDSPVLTFRHHQYPLYKAFREKAPDDLKTQFSLIKEVIHGFGIKIFEIPGYEADDIIASLVKTSLSLEKNLKIKILSNDKDVLQLVSDNVIVYNENRKKEYTPTEVINDYGVKCKELVGYFAIIGDTADNIPGIPGIGPKTARRLINTFGTISSILNNLDKLEPKLREIIHKNKDALIKNESLIKLVENLNVISTLCECELPVPDSKGLYEIFKKYEFTSLMKELKINEKKIAESIVVTNINFLENICEEIRKVKIVSFFSLIRNNQLIGLAISLPGSNYYLPLNHSTLLSIQQNLDYKIVMEKIYEILVDSSIIKIFHEIKPFLKVTGYNSTIDKSFFDISLAAYLLDPTRGKYDMKTLALEYLSKNLSSLEEIDQKTNPEFASQLMSSISTVLIEMMEKLLSGLDKFKLKDFYFNIELPLIEVLSDMESTGIKIDRRYLESLLEEFRMKLRDIELKIHETVGMKFNINSPQQLSFVLFEKLKLPKIKKTKTGYSTDVEVLKTLSNLSPVVNHILEYRELQKLISTYIQPLLDYSIFDGRIHTVFNQTTTATGRLSSSDPNLQTIPIKTELGKKLRKAFVAEDGKTLLSADYSQIELRLLAHITGDDKLSQAFKNNQDIHSLTASEVLGIDYKDITYEQRRLAKIINFGIIYGISAQGLAEQLNIPVELAARYINSYFQKYQGVKKWIDDTIKQSRKEKIVRTLFGRIRPVPEIVSKNPHLRSFSERVAVNTPIQGSAADLIKMAMVEIYKELKARKMKTKLLLQIHDELIFETVEDELEAAVNIVKQGMTGVYKFNVPLVVDIKYGPNLYDMKEWGK